MRKLWRIDWCKINNDGTYSATPFITYADYEKAAIEFDIYSRCQTNTEWYELVEITEKVISL